MTALKLYLIKFPGGGKGINITYSEKILKILNNQNFKTISLKDNDKNWCTRRR